MFLATSSLALALVRRSSLETSDNDLVLPARHHVRFVSLVAGMDDQGCSVFERELQVSLRAETGLVNAEVEQGQKLLAAGFEGYIGSLLYSILPCFGGSAGASSALPQFESISTASKGIIKAPLPKRVSFRLSFPSSARLSTTVSAPRSITTSRS